MRRSSYGSLAITTPMWPSAGHEENAATSLVQEPPGLDLAVELAHDMRSPLGAMISMAELLQGGACGPVTASQQYQLQLMLQAAKGISRVTSDIIDSARAGSPNGGEVPARFDVPDVLRAVRDVVQPMAESARVKLIARNHAPTTWFGRRTAITRVLLNLTTNAIKSTSNGVVEFGARLLGAERLEFFVHDNGSGLLPMGSDRPVTSLVGQHDRWQRAGSGLGLAISRRLLQTMGTSLDVESRPGKGCRFSFELAFRDSA
jgi:signal transduction histidine kinase